jgi:hypothetical protein
MSDDKSEKPQDEIGKKLELADSWLTKVGIIWKKHWGKLLIIGSIAGVYYFMKWAMSLPVETQTEQVDYYIDSAAYWDSVYVADSIAAEAENAEQ